MFTWDEKPAGKGKAETSYLHMTELHLAFIVMMSNVIKMNIPQMHLCNYFLPWILIVILLWKTVRFLFDFPGNQTFHKLSILKWNGTVVLCCFTLHRHVYGISYDNKVTVSSRSLFSFGQIKTKIPFQNLENTSVSTMAYQFCFLQVS